jgi:hypothetical protein
MLIVIASEKNKVYTSLTRALPDKKLELLKVVSNLRVPYPARLDPDRKMKSGRVYNSIRQK